VAYAAIAAAAAVDDAEIREGEPGTANNDAVTPGTTAATAGTARGLAAAGATVTAGEQEGVACGGGNDLAVASAVTSVSANIAVAVRSTAETAHATGSSGAAATPAAGAPVCPGADTASPAGANRRAGAASASNLPFICIAALAARSLDRLGISCEHAEAETGQQRND
jgi:hypothetical protein